jgi:hypothetical protein
MKISISDLIYISSFTGLNISGKEIQKIVRELKKEKKTK